MNAGILMRQGRNDKPAVIFIHGLGMDMDIWVNPSNCSILGGLFPLGVLLQNVVSNGLRSLFDDLMEREYTVIAWSQERPTDLIDMAVAELEHVVEFARNHKTAESGIILIGHSRGGLIGRKYLLKEDKSVRALVTLSTPHHGSSLARIVRYLSPVVSAVAPLFRSEERGTLSNAVRRIRDFLKSRALKELLPDSEFFSSLHDKPWDYVTYISAGGTDPALFNISGIGFPDVFEKVIPRRLCPEEIKKGMGDGMVSAESSRMPWAQEHYSFHVNHAGILYDREVRETIAKAIENIC
jgi:pimeloyl-ACP methyl ester carboxylesterase